MTPTSLPGRALVVIAGALLGGIVAGTASTWLPSPYPLAFGIAIAIPVMDVAIYPDNVPEDAGAAVTVGVLAALGGIVVGSAVGAAWTAFSLPWPVAFTVGFAYLATEATGRYARSRPN